MLVPEQVKRKKRKKKEKDGKRDEPKLPMLQKVPYVRRQTSQTQTRDSQVDDNLLVGRFVVVQIVSKVVEAALAVSPPLAEETQADVGDGEADGDQHPNDHSEAGAEVHVLEARRGEAELQDRPEDYTCCLVYG